VFLSLKVMFSVIHSMLLLKPVLRTDLFKTCCRIISGKFPGMSFPLKLTYLLEKGFFAVRTEQHAVIEEVPYNIGCSFRSICTKVFMMSQEICVLSHTCTKPQSCFFNVIQIYSDKNPPKGRLHFEGAMLCLFC
jgi:hypothetical protein